MVGVATAMSCGGATPLSAPTTARAPAPLGPLALRVPPGARLVIVARPAALFTSEAAARIVDALVLPGGLDHFTARTGVDPRRLLEAVYAEYDDGASLVLVRGPIDAQLVVEEAGARMSAVESRADHPLVRRAGLFSDERRELVALERDVIVVASGPAIGHLATLLACVTSSRGRCPSAFAGNDAAALFAAHQDAPLAFFAPTGLTLPEGFGTTDLLAGTRAVVAVVEPHELGELDVELEFRGRFPSGAEENFRALLRSVAATDLGTMVGLRTAAEHATVHQLANGVRLQTTLELAPLLYGLEVLFAGEIRGLLAPSPTRPSGLLDGGAVVGATIENHK